MSPHVIDPLELFALVEINLWGSVIIKFVIVLQKFVTESVPHDVRVDYIQVNNLISVFSFLVLMSFFTLDKLDGLDRKCKEHLFLKQISLIAYLNMLQLRQFRGLVLI